MANASLYGDDMIVGNSLSIHFGTDKLEYDIDACCTITQMLNDDGAADRRAFRKARRTMSRQMRKIKRARREDEDDDRRLEAEEIISAFDDLLQ